MTDDLRTAERLLDELVKDASRLVVCAGAIDFTKPMRVKAVDDGRAAILSLIERLLAENGRLTDVLNTVEDAFPDTPGAIPNDEVLPY